jgi:PAS domain S-box-containing protein
VLARRGLLPDASALIGTRELWVLETILFGFIGLFLYLLVRSLQDNTQQINEQADELRRTVQDLKETSVSRNYLDYIIESMAELLIVTRPDGTIEKANRTALGLLGYACANDIVGKPITTLLPDAQTLNQNPRETVCLKHNGQKLPVSVSASPLYDVNNQPIGTVYVAQDLTQFQKIRQDLDISNARYETAISASDAGVVDWDISSGMLFVDPNLKRLLGIDEPESIVTFSKARRYIDPEDRRMLVSRFRSLQANGEARFEAEYRLKHADGSPVWVLGRGQIVFDAQGKALRAIIANIDLNQRKKDEQRSLDLMLEREKVRLLTEFVEASGHSFRTILNVITASSWLLKRVEDPQKRIERLQIIEDQAYLLKKLFDNMFLLLKLDTASSLRLDPQDLNVLVREVLYRTERYAEKQGIRLESSLDEAIGNIYADSDELGQAILNIVENAITFNEQGGTVRVTTAIHGDHVRLTVTDDGLGIPDAKLNHIFDRMYKVDEARSRGGLGLGLAIARRIVELHQGHIEVVSKEDVGSVFTIVLPRKPVLTEPIPDDAANGNRH